MTKIDCRSATPPAGRGQRPNGTRTVIVVIVVVALWAGLTAIGVPPQAAAAGLGAAARIALYLAAGLPSPAPRRGLEQRAGRRRGAAVQAARRA